MTLLPSFAFFFNCINFYGRVGKYQVLGTRHMLLSTPHWTRSLCSSAEAIFCQNRLQPQQLPRGKVMILVCSQKQHCGSDPQQAMRQSKKKWRREAMCNFQMTSQLINTVFLSHPLLCWIKVTLEVIHVIACTAETLQLCWEKLCTSCCYTDQLSAIHRKHMQGENANLLSLAEFIKRHRQDGDAQISLEEDCVPTPMLTCWPQVDPCWEAKGAGGEGTAPYGTQASPQGGSLSDRPPPRPPGCRMWGLESRGTWPSHHLKGRNFCTSIKQGKISFHHDFKTCFRLFVCVALFVTLKWEIIVFRSFC